MPALQFDNGLFVLVEMIALVIYLAIPMQPETLQAIQDFGAGPRHIARRIEIVDAQQP